MGNYLQVKKIMEEQIIPRHRLTLKSHTISLNKREAENINELINQLQEKNHPSERPMKISKMKKWKLHRSKFAILGIPHWKKKKSIENNPKDEILICILRMIQNYRVSWEKNWENPSRWIGFHTKCLKWPIKLSTWVA